MKRQNYGYCLLNLYQLPLSQATTKFWNSKQTCNLWYSFESINKKKIQNFQSISNITHMSIQQDAIKFYHQCIFSTPASTWITVIINNSFTVWPGFTGTAVILSQKQQLKNMSSIHQKAYFPQHNQTHKENHCR